MKNGKRVVSNHPLLVGRNDEDFHAAVLAGDAKGIGRIRIIIDGQAQPAEPFAYAPADIRVVLADPGREDNAIDAPSDAVSAPNSRTARQTKSSTASWASLLRSAVSVRISLDNPETPSKPDLR